MSGFYDLKRCLITEDASNSFFPAAIQPAHYQTPARRKDPTRAGTGCSRKAHAKTKEDVVAIVIGANRELTPPSCSPPFCHRTCQHPPASARAHVRYAQPQSRGCSRTSFGGSMAGASGDWRDVYADVGAGPAWSEGFNGGRIVKIYEIF